VWTSMGTRGNLRMSVLCMDLQHMKLSPSSEASWPWLKILNATCEDLIRYIGALKLGSHWMVYHKIFKSAARLLILKFCSFGCLGKREIFAVLPFCAP